MSFGPGSIVAGRYHADRLVGTGGMGEVWAGEHVTVGNKVALKRLLPAAAQHHEVVTRFRREAVLLGRIRSDYVARVVDFIDDVEFGPVLVMEFIEGPSLAQILEDRALGVEEAVELAADLAAALCDLHDAKIVHRDLKPGNIIMQPQPGARSRAVIVDFGIGRQLAAKGSPEEVTGITRANIALGTVEYMAPEQILNSRDVTPLSDIYAVGAILYRSVAGVHAFGSRRGEELARAKLIDEAPRLNVGRTDEVARGLSDLVERALKKRPALRFASASDLREAVRSLMERIQIDELDLESTTAATRLFSPGNDPAPPTPLLAAPPPSAPRPPAQDRNQRASMPSMSDAAPIPSIAEIQGHPGRGSLPSISDIRVAPMHQVPVPQGRGSMHSLSDGFAVGLGDASVALAPRASMPSIPPMSDAFPRPARLDTIAPPGVGKKTVGLAVLTAFAVGAALGLVLAPTAGGPRANAAPVASASCACPSAPPGAAVVDGARTGPTKDSAEVGGQASSAAPSPSSSVASVGSAGPKPVATTAPVSKPVLSGHMPEGSWTPPTSQQRPSSAPTAIPLDDVPPRVPGSPSTVDTTPP